MVQLSRVLFQSKEKAHGFSPWVFVLCLKGVTGKDMQVATCPEVDETSVIVGWVEETKGGVVRFKCKVVDACQGFLKQGFNDSVFFSCIDVKHFS